MIGSAIALGQTLVTDVTTMNNITFMDKTIAFIFAIPAIFQYRFNKKNSRTQRANWILAVGLFLLLVSPSNEWLFLFYIPSIVLYMIGTVFCCLPRYTKAVKANVELNHINSGYEKPSFGVKNSANGFTYKKKK